VRIHTLDLEGEVLLIDARSLGAMESRTLRILSELDLKTIADTYHSWRAADPGRSFENVPGFAKSVLRAELEHHGFSLGPGWYVGSTEVEETGETIDAKIARLRSDLFAEFDEGNRLESAIRRQIGAISR
jgi:type I restriction enzyme M protein